MKNLKIALALLAAFALIFAAGCPNDGLDEVYSDLEDSNGSSTDGGGTGGTSGGTASSNGSPSHSADESGPAEGYYYDTDALGVRSYHVYTASGLQEWADYVNAGNYSTNCTLADDIDMANTSWTPVGSGFFPYTGTFDGGNYKVSNLAIESSATYVGFFGHIGSGGEVKNLTLYNPKVTAEDDYSSYAGGIVGYNAGSIGNCTVSGGEVTAKGYQSRVGGIAGNNDGGTITACYSTASVTGVYAGGIAGYNDDNITACYYSNASEGVGDGDDSGVAKVTGNVTWETAQNAMNGAIDNSVGWKCTGANSGTADTDAPTLTK